MTAGITNDYCCGCGYYWYTHDRTHRADGDNAAACTLNTRQDNTIKGKTA